MTDMHIHLFVIYLKHINSMYSCLLNICLKHIKIIQPGMYKKKKKKKKKSKKIHDNQHPSWHTQNSTQVTLKGLQDDVLDVLGRLAQELLTSVLQDVRGPHDLALGHARHSDRHTLRGLHALTHWVQCHHLQRNTAQDKEIRWTK